MVSGVGIKSGNGFIDRCVGSTGNRALISSHYNTVGCSQTILNGHGGTVIFGIHRAV